MEACCLGELHFGTFFAQHLSGTICRHMVFALKRIAELWFGHLFGKFDLEAYILNITFEDHLDLILWKFGLEMCSSMVLAPGPEKGSNLFPGDSFWLLLGQIWSPVAHFGYLWALGHKRLKSAHH